MSVLPTIRLQGPNNETLREIGPYFVPISVEHMQATEEQVDVATPLARGQSFQPQHQHIGGSQGNLKLGLNMETPMRHQASRPRRDDTSNLRDFEPRGRSKTPQHGERTHHESGHDHVNRQQQTLKLRTMAREPEAQHYQIDRRPSPLGTRSSGGQRARPYYHRSHADEHKTANYEQEDSFDEPMQLARSDIRRRNDSKVFNELTDAGRKDTQSRTVEYVIRDERTPIQITEIRHQDNDRGLKRRQQRGVSVEKSRERPDRPGGRREREAGENPLDRIEREVDRQERQVQHKRPTERLHSDHESGRVDFIFERYEETFPPEDPRRDQQRSLSKKRVRESRREVTVIREEDFDTADDQQPPRQFKALAAAREGDRDKRIMIGDYSRARATRTNNY